MVTRLIGWYQVQLRFNLKISKKRKSCYIETVQLFSLERKPRALSIYRHDACLLSALFIGETWKRRFSSMDTSAVRTQSRGIVNWKRRFLENVDFKIVMWLTLPLKGALKRPPPPAIVASSNFSDVEFMRSRNWTATNKSIRFSRPFSIQIIICNTMNQHTT